jgi:2-haloacid dehalogenase/putative hydrolase of the HAD superfamily
MDRDAFLEAWDRHFFPLIRGDFLTLREADVVSLERTFRELGIEDAARGHIDALFERFNSAPAYPDVRPTLADLDGRVVTGVLSNADVENIDGALRTNGLRFPVVVTSEGVRCYKPRPEIFRQALALLGRRAEETLYVGDSQEDDVGGARGAGLRVAWLNRRGEALRPGTPAPDYEIRDLREVLKVVGP